MARPHVPGDLAVWKDALNDKPDSKLVRTWGKKARSWNNSEQLLEAMASLSRLESDTGPLQSYLTLSEIDARRPVGKGLSPTTARLLTSRYPQFSSWYLGLLRVSRLERRVHHALHECCRFDWQYLEPDTAPECRRNLSGEHRDMAGFARQGEIPASEMNASWLQVIEPFAKGHVIGATF